MIIDHIEIKKAKISEQEYSKFVIQPVYRTIQSYLT